MIVVSTLGGNPVRRSGLAPTSHWTMNATPRGGKTTAFHGTRRASPFLKNCIADGVGLYFGSVDAFFLPSHFSHENSRGTGIVSLGLNKGKESMVTVGRTS